MYLTNLALLAAFLTLGFTLGFGAVAIVQVSVTVVAAMVGVWLFSIQHRFEQAIWSRQAAWHPVSAALGGTSYLELPRLLQWFTGNIGFHHVHHLNSRIPNYRLEACHAENPAFQSAYVMKPWLSLQAWRAPLWDERSSRMVPFPRTEHLNCTRGRGLGGVAEKTFFSPRRGLGSYRPRRERRSMANPRNRPPPAQPAGQVAETRRLTVHHVSTYRYSAPVRFGEHRMMFRPRSGHDLRLVAAELRITPTPERLYWLHDVFDNSVTVATFAAEAKELVFESEIALDHVETPLPDYALDPGAATYPFAYSEEEAPDLVEACKRRYPDGEVDAWARGFVRRRGKTGTMALLRAMTLAIKSDFRYRRRIEKGVNHPADTLRDRSGSCRDFAVLMMEAVRSLGLAARFVSGYIFSPGRRPCRAAARPMPGCRSICRVPAGSISIRPTASSAIAISFVLP